jgi:hypothetical protein
MSDQRRKDFERWALQQPWIKDCQRNADGSYGHYETRKAWAAWQAASDKKGTP